MNKMDNKFILSNPAHVTKSVLTKYGLEVLIIHIKTELGAKAIKKPPGRYYNIQFDSNSLVYKHDQKNIAFCTSDCLKSLLEPYYGGNLLIVGLGNPLLMHDSLGPRVVQISCMKTFASFSNDQKFAKVSAITPGVEGVTNLKTIDIIKALISSLDITCVLLIDSMSTKEIINASSSIQISNAGLKPTLTDVYLNQDTLNVPVFGIGMPTVLSDDIIGNVIRPDLQGSILRGALVISASIIMTCFADQNYDEIYDLLLTSILDNAGNP